MANDGIGVGCGPYVAVFPTAVAFFAWYEAMRRIELALLNVMQYLTPVFTIVLASMLLHERLAACQWLGVALVLGGVMASGFAPEKTAEGA